MIVEIKRFLRDLINDVTRSEKAPESKKKWNELADEHARYFIMSDFGKDIDETKFRETGKNDYKQLVQDDTFLRSKVGNFSEKTFLEIGCGIGRLLEFASLEFKSVFGIDISDKMIGMAKDRLKDKANINLFATDGSTFPLPDESIDVVFSYIVFQHMADRKTIRKNFEESARVLKPGGIMKVQLRGIPTEKKHWFYGPSYDAKQAKKVLDGLPLNTVKMEGEKQKYFWLWLEKNPS